MNKHAKKMSHSVKIYSTGVFIILIYGTNTGSWFIADPIDFYLRNTKSVWGCKSLILNNEEGGFNIMPDKPIYLSEYAPKNELVVESHYIKTPRFPAIDIHIHFGSLQL